MHTKIKIGIVVLLIVEAIFFGIIFFGNVDFQLLFPAGYIAEQQRNLLLLATGIILTIIIPVFVTVFLTAYRYRENAGRHDTPGNQKHSRFLEISWWVWPSSIILIIALITWRDTHRLDPYRSLDSNSESLKVQVVSLQWKWLFLYPAQHIATVNYLQLPVNTPIEFELTSDAPMNSFWIPSLSGQVYTMTGMSTKLHVLAKKLGEYSGMAAEINGKGYSGMRFVTKVTSSTDFNRWVHEVQAVSRPLTLSGYSALSSPSENSPAAYYSTYDKDLYDTIIMKYMSAHSKGMN